jgi:hypothetical protein
MIEDNKAWDSAAMERGDGEQNTEGKRGKRTQRSSARRMRQTGAAEQRQMDRRAQPVS